MMIFKNTIMFLFNHHDHFTKPSQHFLQNQ